MNTPTAKRNVAIIGGGFAAMAAAWDLTSPGESGDPPPCEVTIFQIGGRLGGKAASSRNAEQGDRIEEHGLHLWLGYYENAFRMVKDCFSELKGVTSSDPELRPHLDIKPFNNWEWLSAFERANLVGLADFSSGDWQPWIARFPEYVPESENNVTGIYQVDQRTSLPGIHLVKDKKRAYPGEKPEVAHGSECESGEDVCLKKPNVAFFLTHALRELQAFVDSLEMRVDHLYIRRNSPPPEDPEELLSRALNLNPVTHPEHLDMLDTDIPRALRMIRLSLLVPAIQAISTVARFAEGPVPYARNQLVTLLDRFIDEMREKIEHFVLGDAPARRTWELIDLLAANIRGLLAAGLGPDDDFASLDDWNYIDWLRFNRIAERTLKNPLVRGAHDLGFAYYGGDPRNPQIAAGQAIGAACRFFFMYKGALFWRMRAGTGEVVFAPLYLALRRRGVKFRFFHRLDKIVLGRSKTGVTRLNFHRQVRLKRKGAAATNYQPLIVVRHQRLSAWRAKPDQDQLDYDAATRKKFDRAVSGQDRDTYANFESIWCNWTAGDDVFATVGDEPRHENDPTWIGHFDDVIVTVPIAALGRVSEQLRDAPGKGGEQWRSMLQNFSTVATQSMQLWVRKPTRELGWPHGQVSFSAFVHPFDTWADLSQLIDVENQKDAGGLHYFCSVLPEQDVPEITDTTGPRQVVDRLDAVKSLVKQNAKSFLNNWIFQLWHDAADRYPNIFKWHLLVDQHGRLGVQRLDAQYFVANVDPSERYTQSLPGTTKYRIRPDGTGFEHLYIAGDWTNCGLNFGCLEAAVMSGRLASAAIRGYPDTRLIPGYVGPTKRTVAAQGGR